MALATAAPILHVDAPAPEEKLAGSRWAAGRCWRCGGPLDFRLVPGGMGQVQESCPRCVVEIEALTAELRRLRPPAPPVVRPPPVVQPERPRYCRCGRKLRRRRDGRHLAQCYFCERGREPPRRT